MLALPRVVDHAQSYSEFIWWWLHHSDDPERIAVMLGSYYDESAIDGGGPVSVVGGLVLSHERYCYIEDEWNRAIDRHKPGRSFIHMKDFGSNGCLSDFPKQSQRALFSELARIIIEHRHVSIGSTLKPCDYREVFAGIPKYPGMTIHGCCFLNAALLQSVMAEKSCYRPNIPFMLDRGCPDDKDINLAHKYLTGQFEDFRPNFPTHVGMLTWADDTEIPALQAADVVAWAVRRKTSGLPFGYAYEPLAEIVEPTVDGRHIEADYSKDLMIEAMREFTIRA